MSIKLVAIDIDGTLLNEKREITADVKEAIAQAVAKGVFHKNYASRQKSRLQTAINNMNK